MPAGQPKKYSIDKVTKGIAKYFKDTEEKDYTICGLALEIGFCERKQLNEYSKYAEYSPIVKRAMLKIEYGYEKKLSGTCVTGSIFALKNMKWRDKSDEEIQAEKEINLDDLKKEIRELVKENGFSK